MNSPNREEIDPKLQTVEARLDGRVAAIQATIAGMMTRMEDSDRRSDEHFKEMGQRITRVENAVSNLKMTTIVTAISAVIAIVLGVGAINATLLSNMIAAFQAGGNMSATQAEVKRQVEQTAILLRQLQAQAPPAGSGAQSPAAPANPPKQP